MLLTAGSYERFLFGFEAPGSKVATNAGEPATLTRKFTYAAHQGPIKCLAAAGHYLASGGTDDQIHLYDLKHGKDLGYLMNPGDGAVPCIQFYSPTPQVAGGSTNPSHMFSGSNDGTIAIWQAGRQWDFLKPMKGHKGSVNALSVHPSGRLALSTAHDMSMRMWDLTKGRCQYTATLDAEGDDIAFSPRGQSFVLTCGAKVTVHATGGEGGLISTFMHPRRVMSSLQHHEDVLLTGLEDGSIKVWDLRAKGLQSSIERAHSTRIRGLAAASPPGDGLSLPQQLASASTDGVVQVWDMRMLGRGGGDQGGGKQAAARPPLVSKANTGARITCLASSSPHHVVAPLVKQASKAVVPKVELGEVKKKRERITLERKQGPKKEGRAGAGAEGKKKKANVKGSAEKQGGDMSGVSEGQVEVVDEGEGAGVRKMTKKERRLMEAVAKKFDSSDEEEKGKQPSAGRRRLEASKTGDQGPASQPKLEVKGKEGGGGKSKASMIRKPLRKKVGDGLAKQKRGNNVGLKSKGVQKKQGKRQ